MKNEIKAISGRKRIKPTKRTLGMMSPLLILANLHRGPGQQKGFLLMALYTADRGNVVSCGGNIPSGRERKLPCTQDSLRCTHTGELRRGTALESYATSM